MPARLAPAWEGLGQSIQPAQAAALLKLATPAPSAPPPAPAFPGSAPVEANSFLPPLGDTPLWQWISQVMFNATYGQLTTAQQAQVRRQAELQIRAAAGCDNPYLPASACNEALARSQSQQMARELASVFSQSEQEPSASALPSWVWLVAVGAILWVIAR